MDIRTMAIVAASLWLAACGGSGGGGGGGTSTPPPGNGTGTSGTYSLEATPTTAAAALAQMQQQGTSGYAWVSGVASYQASPQLSELYLHSSLRQNSTFLYQMDGEPAAMADLLTLLNQRGGQGYAYKGGAAYNAATYSVFVKDSAKTSTYSYESLGSVNSSLTDLLAQLNAQGARGFRWLGLYATAAATASLSNLYAKEGSGPATYAYSAISLGTSFAPANGTALSQALQQGAADGSRFLGVIVVGSQYAMIFERPAGSTTAPGYTIESVPANESLATMLQSINAKAAQGVFLWSDVVTADGQFHRVYVSGQVLPHPLYGIVYP
jgi:hypothetical protein